MVIQGNSADTVSRGDVRRPIYTYYGLWFNLMDGHQIDNYINAFNQVEK